MIENTEQLKTFLAGRGDETIGHDFWELNNKAIKKEFLGPQEYIPEGLFEYAPKTYEEIGTHIISTETSKTMVIFQMVNLDVRPDSAEKIIGDAIRWQGFPQHDAMIVCSINGERMNEARTHLSHPIILQTQAVFLCDISNITS